MDWWDFIRFDDADSVVLPANGFLKKQYFINYDVQC